MKNLMILFFIYSSYASLAQDGISLKGTVFSEEGVPVQYASIINITTNKHGATSDEHGNFYLKTRQNYQDKIQITALGFYELRGSLKKIQELASSKKLILREKPFILDEIEIKGDRYEKKFIGKSVELLLKEDNSFFSDAIGEGPGYSEGVFIRPQRKTKGLIDKIHFYITDDSPLNKSFTVRLLRSEDKLKNNLGYKIDQFNEMTDSILLVEGAEPGWNTLDLYSSEIFVDAQPFFILFTNLESTEESKSRSLEDSFESIKLGAFADRTPKEIYKALSFNGIILFLANDRIKTPIPAVYLEYSTIN